MRNSAEDGGVKNSGKQHESGDHVARLGGPTKTSDLGEKSLNRKFNWKGRTSSSTANWFDMGGGTNNGMSTGDVD